MSYEDALARAITSVIEPNARAVDEQGTFPEAGIAALAEAGVLGLTAARRSAAAVPISARPRGDRAARERVRLDRDGRADALRRDRGDRGARSRAGAARDRRRARLTTLAFSEAGSRSHFWAPLGTATAEGDAACASTRARAGSRRPVEADSYVWSSQPLAADGPMTLWLVPADAAGLGAAGRVRRPRPARQRLAPDHAPTACVVDCRRRARRRRRRARHRARRGAALVPGAVSAAFSLGLMEAVIAETHGHVTRPAFEHLDQALAEQPVPRVDLARMRIETDAAARLLARHARRDRRPAGPTRCCACWRSRPRPREAALERHRPGDEVCGGAAFRKEVGVERRFRDARAARVMAPTTDALLDFIGRAVCGLPLLDACRHDAATTLTARRRRLRPEGRHDLGGLPRLVRASRTSRSTTSCTRNYERQVEALLAGSIDVAWNSPLAWVRTGGWPRRTRHRASRRSRCATPTAT